MARAFPKEGIAHENASSILDEEKQEEQYSWAKLLALRDF